MPWNSLTPVFAPIRTIAAALLLAAAVAAAAAGAARAQELPDAALNRLLAEARSTVPAECSRPGIDRLMRILCTGRIRIGVREYYPQFGVTSGNERHGYEIDVARAIAGRLGIAIDFEKVKAATRIPMLANDQVDLTIATMGHNTERDGQVRFIRPHYYRSETTIVGPRDLAVASWADLTGKTVCATVGNGSNAQLVLHDAHLMLFDDADELAARLDDDTCALAAQDDSFFAYYFTQPGFAERFSQKFGFAQLPWGMAVARDASDRLARALDLISQIFHRDGVFLGFARANRLATAFLEEQQAVWAKPGCNTAVGSSNPACILPPFNPALPATPFAGNVNAFEAWFAALTGVELVLPMLKTVPAWSLFLNGMVNSLVLVLGTLAATLAFALLFGAMLGSHYRMLRWPARAATVTLQSSPIVLTLVVAAALMACDLPVFRRHGDERRDPGARAHERRQCRAGNLRGDGNRARRACRGASGGYGDILPHAGPVGDADHGVPRERGKGHAHCRLYRRARASQRLDRYHLVFERPGDDLHLAADFLHGRRHGGRVGLRPRAHCPRAPASARVKAVR